MEKSLPPEQSFSRARESYLCADTFVSQHISSQSCSENGTGILERALAETGTCFADYRRILVHQVAMPYLRAFLDVTGVPHHKVEVTLPELGNIASTTLPVAFAQGLNRGEIEPGDKVMWIGLASGISLGVMCMTY